MTNFNWTPAVLSDVESIINISKTHFSDELQHIFITDETAGARNLSLAIVNQYYLPLSELLSVCKDDSGKLLAYTWAVPNQTLPWSDDKMVNVKMAHIDLTLPIKTRIKIIVSMFTLWENFARFANCPVVCSTTVRNDQDGFLKLHSKYGYDVRGSIAFKRLF